MPQQTTTAAATTDTQTPLPSTAYDPNSSTPYTPPPVELPPVTAPPPADLASTSAQRNVRPVFGTGGKAVAGSIAYLGDSILRGYMQGRQQAQAVQADRANKLVQGLQLSYQNDRNNYLSLLQTGKDPNSKEVVAAKNAADASYKVLMTMYYNAVFGGTSKGRSKERGHFTGAGKGGDAGEQPNIAALLTSKNPQEKAQGIFLLTQKAGAPHNYDAQMILAQRQAQQQDPMLQHKQRVARLENDLSVLTALGDRATPEQQQQREALRKQLEQEKEISVPLPKPVAPKPLAGTKPYKGPDGRYYQSMLVDGMVRAEPMPPGYTPPPDKQNRDDKYIAITQKPPATWTDDEKAYVAAYDTWVRKTKVDPGVARAAAFGANRYMPVLDPNDPENVILMRVGDAAAAHISTPASISFQIDKAISRAFTSGQPAQTINYFNTAAAHIKLLGETVKALHNNDVQAFNKAANAVATALGMPAPTDFNAVRNAVAGELSKTFRGAAATEEEVRLVNETINNAQSPEQLAHVIHYYSTLMGSKLDAMRAQYEAGKRGKPAFPERTEQAPTEGKTLTMAQVGKAAKDHNVSVEAAIKQAEGQGYTVTGKPAQVAAPAASKTVSATTAPPSSKAATGRKVLDEAAAQKLLDEAGGDPAKARRRAKELGYEIPK